jgi:adenosylcobinamide-GDP ribazoletransferase
VSARAAIGAEARRLLTAVQFLTRLPVPDTGWEEGRMLGASRYFALVGALVGALMALAWLAAGAVLPAPVAAGIALGAGLLVTGALHEDGLADVADGLGGGADRARALEIMRDSRLGSFGALALLVVLGLRWAALAGLPPAEGALALVLAAAAGRALMVPATALAPYARSEGLGGGLRAGAGPAEIAAALGTAGVLALLCGQAGALALAAAAATGYALLRLMRARLGGYTGDGLGALAALGETAALVALAGAWA